MIGRLAGQIVYRAEDHVLIDVRGVGYVVHVSERTLAALPGPGEAVALWTDLLVREDLMQLIGFLTLEEKEWHRLLIGVQGIGTKASLSILGALGPEGVSRAIALGDWNAIKAAKGIGPKTAQRIVNELRDKAPAVMAMAAGEARASVPDPAGSGAEPAAPAPVPSSPAPAPAARAEALSALSNLGYAPAEAAAAVATALGEAPDADTEALIRAALRLLAPK
ncbi:MAG: Holliday junction branch migration protein RuvA, partial [Alphaproteobacteria bacterium]